MTDIYSSQYPGPSLRIKKTVQVRYLTSLDIRVVKKKCYLQAETTKVLIKENGVTLHLTIVDTPGFGDAVDNSEW